MLCRLISIFLYLDSNFHYIPLGTEKSKKASTQKHYGGLAFCFIFGNMVIFRLVS